MPDPVIPIPVSGGLSGLGADAAGLNSMLSLLFGNKQTTTTNIGGTTTTDQNIVDPSVIADTVRGLMEGNGGLASILTGQSAAGGYGGNTAGLQVNDLVARITGAVAKVTAANVKTTSGSTNSSTTGTEGKGPQAAALAALAAALKGMSKGASGGKDSGGKGGGGGGGKDSPTPTDQSENKDSAANFAKDITDNAKELDLEPEGPAPSQDQLTENLLNDTPAPPDVQFDEPDTPAPGDGEGEGNGTGDLGDGNGDGDLNSSDDGDDNIGTDDENNGDYGGDGGDGGCFITTAVIGSRGLSDDCAELEILRAYRDNWLKFHHPEGIKMYYESAPRLVEKIDARADSKEFYNTLYSTYIVPAIALILLLDPVEAYNKYREMVIFVQKNA